MQNFQSSQFLAKHQNDPNPRRAKAMIETTNDNHKNNRPMDFLADRSTIETQRPNRVAKDETKIKNAHTMDFHADHEEGPRRGILYHQERRKNAGENNTPAEFLANQHKKPPRVGRAGVNQEPKANNSPALDFLANHQNQTPTHHAKAQKPYETNVTELVGENREQRIAREAQSFERCKAMIDHRLEKNVPVVNRLKTFDRGQGDHDVVAVGASPSDFKPHVNLRPVFSPRTTKKIHGTHDERHAKDAQAFQKGKFMLDDRLEKNVPVVNRLKTFDRGQGDHDVVAIGASPSDFKPVVNLRPVFSPRTTKKIHGSQEVKEQRTRAISVMTNSPGVLQKLTSQQSFDDSPSSKQCVVPPHANKSAASGGILGFGGMSTEPERGAGKKLNLQPIQRPQRGGKLAHINPPTQVQEHLAFDNTPSRSRSPQTATTLPSWHGRNDTPHF